VSLGRRNTKLKITCHYSAENEYDFVYCMCTVQQQWKGTVEIQRKIISFLSVYPTLSIFFLLFNSHIYLFYKYF
jgi:hypothetical protein